MALWVFAVLLVAASADAKSGLDVSVDTNDGSYKILMSGTVWFNSGPVMLRNAGKRYTSEDGTLLFRSYAQSTGEDVWGTFNATSLVWKTSDGLNFVTHINSYQNAPILTFVQEFTDGVTGASNNNLTNETISSFPTLLIEELDLSRGSLTYNSAFAQYVAVEEWSPSVPLAGGIDGGTPLVIFDSAMQNTVVISPANTFMTASQSTWQPKTSSSPAVGFGIISSVDTVPPHYYFSTVLVGGQNVTGTMDTWGQLLRTLYKKDDTTRRNDFSNNYLGYWTDNGACYYYNTGTYSNYEDVLEAVKTAADQQGIPYRYLQIDSWWYYKGLANGVKNWTAMPSIFPNGIDSVVQKTGWPVVAHNRYWSADTDYAKQNGGQYNFIIEGDYALPNDSSFWQFLLSSAQREWDLWVYEQDWLYTVYNDLPALQQDLFLGRDWLLQMGKAAEELGITIQYCMPWTRHILQSVEIPAVTQVRASDDYQPGNYQWAIGDTTILAHSVGLAAFKDDFHSTSVQAHCQFGTEPYPSLETYVAALSAGPIGPSDTVGETNKTLVMATCMSDGRLLKPTRPAMSLDSTFLYRAFGQGGPNGLVYAAFTEVTLWTWYYLFAANVAGTYLMQPSELPPSRSVFPATFFPQSVVFTYDLSGKVLSIQSFPSTLSIPSCTRNFQYYTIAPILGSTGIALLGELNKIIPVSETRFVQISQYGPKFALYLTGAPGEVVVFTVYIVSGGSTATVTCNIPSSGTAVLKIPDLECDNY